MNYEKGSVETLKPGQTLLVGIRKVGDDDAEIPKVQLELAEIKLKKEHNTVGFEEARTVDSTLLQELNSTDSRFTGTRPRRAWMTADKSVVEKEFGVDLSSLVKKDDRIELNYLSPQFKGQKLRVQIREHFNPTDYDMENVESQAKRAGADGRFLTYQGQLVFTDSQVVAFEPKDQFYQSDPTPQNAPIMLESVTGQQNVQTSSPVNSLLVDQD